jgi:flagellar motor switch protein FliN
MNGGSLQDVKVPISVVLGETEVSVAELASIAEGSIIELKSIAGEPVRLMAAGEQIAWGEVVIIEENFGLRVTGLTV